MILNDIIKKSIFSSVGTLIKEKIHSKEYFYHQTNYYIIKNKIKFHPDKENIYQLYNTYKSRVDVNQKPWECIPHCDCESFLKKDYS